MHLKLLLLTILFELQRAESSKNLLINGNFSYDKLPNGLVYLLTYNVTGWTSINNFQLVNAAHYNYNWPNYSQAVQIADPANETLSQVFQSGNYDYYNLSFQYSFHPAFDTNLYNQTRIQVMMNGVLLQQLSLSDILIHKKTIQLMLNTTRNQIMFSPNGLGGVFGMAFTNIEMIGFCNQDRNYSQIQIKCVWNPIQNCQQIDQVSGNCSFWNPIKHCLQIDQTSGNCTMCQKLFIPLGNTCKCQPRFYFSKDSCKPCLLPCEECEASPRNCLSCAQLYVFQGNQCQIADASTKSVASVASMPGFQFLSVGQILIGSLNQFWPYYSHHRQYGQQTEAILTFIHTIQNNKWFLMGFDKKIDFNFNSLNFSDFGQYSNQKFLRKQNKSSYFWDGAFEIFFFTFPVLLLMFFLLRKIFYLTFSYQISRYFRLYSSFFMIYIMLFEGNVSFLGFLSFSNAMNLFSFKFQDKVGQSLSILVSFSLIFFCVGGFLVLKILYNKHSQHFISNVDQKIQSFFLIGFLLIEELIIGALNSFLATEYEILIISLGSVEIIKIVGLIYFQMKHKCYKIESFMYISIIKSINMVLFNVFLWIDWKQRINGPQQLNKQAISLLDYSCKTLILIIIGAGVFQIISSYFSERKRSNFTVQSQKIVKRKSQKQKITQRHSKISKINCMKLQQNRVRNNFHNNKQLCYQQMAKKQTNNKENKLLKQRKDKNFHVIWEQNEKQNIEVIFLTKK